MSPNQRTYKRLRELGFDFDPVERNLGKFVKKDFCGCIDIIAWNDAGAIGIQVTSGSNHAARRTKMYAEPRLRRCVNQTGIKPEIWSWSKVGPRGKRKTWTLNRERIEIDNITTA